MPARPPHTKKKERPPAPRRVSRGWLVAGAGAVLVAAAVASRAIFPGPPSPVEQAAIAEKYLEPFPIPAVFGTLPPEAPYRAGVDAYRRRDYERAVESFSRLTGTPDRWPGVLFYRGLSQLFAGQAAAAAGSFRDHLRREPGSAPAQWYLALALLREGREAEARRELEAIAARTKSDYSGQASAVLRDLR